MQAGCTTHFSEIVMRIGRTGCKLHGVLQCRQRVFEQSHLRLKHAEFQRKTGRPRRLLACLLKQLPGTLQLALRLKCARLGPEFFR